MKDPNCIFCKIIDGEIPSYKIIETERTFSFLDINPIAEGHSLVIPKHHAQKLHEVPDEYLSEILVVAKQIASKLGVANYNLLQNNGRLAHQEVDHVHFHLIPKTSEEDGLNYRFKPLSKEHVDLEKVHKKLV